MTTAIPGEKIEKTIENNKLPKKDYENAKQNNLKNQYDSTSPRIPVQF